jgi:hypothetical protein
LDNQVWPALERHRQKFPAYVWRQREIETSTGGKIIGFVTDEATRVEGWHAESDGSGPLLYILDEAKSIPEPIFQGVDRCTYNGLLYISSAGLMQGSFYESQRGKVADRFLRRAVRLDECPHIDKERIADVIARYGNDHPFTRSTLYSEFTNQDGAQAFFVTLQAYEKCLESPPNYKPGDRVAFCDFAGGGDENVFAVREGNRIRLIRSWREANEMAAVGEFIREFRKEGLKAEEIWGDNCGAGKPMIARFHELNWPINRFNGGEAAFNNHDYCNRNAEVWDQTSRAIDRRELILPEDETLRAQIVSRRRAVDAKGRMKCESKEDMLKRGLKSPDRADAVVGCAALREPKAYGRDDIFRPKNWMQEVGEAAIYYEWGDMDDAVNMAFPGGWNT